MHFVQSTVRVSWMYVLPLEMISTENCNTGGQVSFR